jgi:cell division protein FtsL
MARRTAQSNTAEVRVNIGQNERLDDDPRSYGDKGASSGYADRAQEGRSASPHDAARAYGGKGRPSGYADRGQEGRSARSHRDGRRSDPETKNLKKTSRHSNSTPKALRQAARQAGKVEMRQQTLKEAHESVASARVLHLTAGEKIRMLIAAIFMSGLLLGLVLLTAWSAAIQSDINRTNAQGAVVQEEIDALKVQIEQSRNISVIQQRATDELHMLYPSAQQLVYVEDLKVQTASAISLENLAQTIREKAYENW